MTALATTPSTARPTAASTVTVRQATRGDATALARLAHRSTRRRPRGRMLIAERRGVPVAALALTSGVVVADMSSDPAAALRALRHRRYQLLRQGGEVGRLAS
jgi:hypothetical protein